MTKAFFCIKKPKFQLASASVGMLYCSLFHNHKLFFVRLLSFHYLLKLSLLFSLLNRFVSGNPETFDYVFVTGNRNFEESIWSL